MPTTTPSHPSHLPWRSPTSAWWTASALAAVTFLFTALSGQSSAWERWYYLGLAEGVMALQPLVTALMTVTATGAVVLAWRRPVVSIALLLLFVPASLTYGWSLGWWLAVVLVAVLTSIRGSWFAVAPWLGAAAMTFFFCRSGESFATPIGPIFLRPEDTTYLWVWSGMLGAALVAAVVARLILLAARRSEAAETATATAEAVTVDAARRSAVVTERSVVARDLHDVVAHHVSLVAVRAESAPYVLTDLDENARKLFTEIAADARAALAELRSALVVLDRGAGGALSTSSAPRAPLPVAEDALALLAQARGAGQEVVADDAALAEQLDAVDPAAGYVVYRTLQEALTNVRRHAAGAVANVALAASTDGVELVIANDAPSGSSAPVHGRGLLGMVERAESLHGTLSAGLEDGQFVVRLALPGVDARRPADAR